MASRYHINPRVRAYGKARIDITQRARDEQEWQTQWREPLHNFAFDIQGDWRHCIEYKVDDFAAEVGFFIDFLGFSVSAFSPVYAQLTDPRHEFYFALSATQEGEESTPPDTLRLQFQVANLDETFTELEKRGIDIEAHTLELHPNSPMKTCNFRSPHGINIELLSVHRQEIDQPNYTENFISQVENAQEGLPDISENQPGFESLTVGDRDTLSTTSAGLVEDDAVDANEIIRDSAASSNLEPELDENDGIDDLDHEDDDTQLTEVEYETIDEDESMLLSQDHAERDPHHSEYEKDDIGDHRLPAFLERPSRYSQRSSRTSHPDKSSRLTNPIRSTTNRREILPQRRNGEPKDSH